MAVLEFAVLRNDGREALKGLFCSTFSASEGRQEGELIGELAAQLSVAMDDADVIGFGALQDQSLIGAIFFTRLWFHDDALVYLLAPVAVSPAHQGSGVGKALIQFALDAMTGRGASVAITYGDPAFYAKVGFKPLSESVLKAPMKLSMPMGWLGQSLTGRPIEARQEQPRCVEAFRNPVYW